MSADYPTVNEAIAYDDGFKDAKDYWEPALIEQLTRWLIDRDIIRESLFGNSYVAFCTDGKKVTEFNQLGEDTNGNNE